MHNNSQIRCSRPDWCIIDTWPTLVKVYGSMYVSKAMNILLKVLRVKNLDGLFDPASEVSGVIPNLYYKSPWAKWALKIASLSVHTPYWCTHFCPPKKTTFGKMFPSLHTPYCGAHIFAKKNTILEGFTPSTIPLTGAHILDKITTTFQV